MLKRSKVNVPDAMLYVIAAWATVKPSFIENYFKKARFITGSQEEEMSDNKPDDVLLQSLNYVSLEEDVATRECVISKKFGDRKASR